jgi:hypothetical protein
VDSSPFADQPGNVLRCAPAENAQDACRSSLLGVERPRIRPIGWIDASSVLGHEERGFSAWLAENLGLLADALGLPGLTLVERESGVGPYRVDILAVAEDDTDEGLPVAVENQYGGTNHDHLGKLVTYLAGQQRGLGVWISERFSDPHLAAVEFLNRTSDESVGYALVTVKFAPAPDGDFYVDFQVAARPNEWVKTVSESSGRQAAPERGELLSAVHELVEQPLLDAGWARVSYHRRRPLIWLALPDGHPLHPASYFTLRAAPDNFRFRNIAVKVGSFEQSRALVAALRDRYDQRLRERLPPGTTVEWCIDTGANQQNDQWYAQHPGGGYNDLEPADAAEWAIAVCTAWLRLLEGDPPVGMVEQAQRSAPDGE